jgi:hypothetical protein
MQLAPLQLKLRRHAPIKRLEIWEMTHSMAKQTLDSALSTQAATDTVCRRGGVALLALRTKYGLETIDVSVMDRITALRVAATFEFLHNNLPESV